MRFLLAKYGILGDKKAGNLQNSGNITICKTIILSVYNTFRSQEAISENLSDIKYSSWY